MTLGQELANGVSRALEPSGIGQKPIAAHCCGSSEPGPVSTVSTVSTVSNSALKISDPSLRPTQTIGVPDRDSFQNDAEYRAFVERILSDYNIRLGVAKRQQLGYPIYHARDNVEELDLTPLDRFAASYINNVGDPFESTGAFASHSHGFEVGVLQWFANLFSLQDFWGYCSSGGSESNLEALFIARENLPTACTFVSREAHFSVFKALRVLRMPHVVIDCDEQTGEILYDELEQALKSSPYRHAIVVATCGTTMRGAIDSPRRIVDSLRRSGITKHFLHVDAALSGIYVPLLDSHILDFAHVPISSIAVSGHKFLGVPIPCGAFLVRKTFVENMASDNVQYIRSNDLPMSCSRNGLAPLYLWLMLSELGCQRIKADAIRCIKFAREMTDTLNAAGIEAHLNPMSITVVIKDGVDDDFARAWQLATTGNICHVVVMPHIRKEVLSQFCEAIIDHQSRDKSVYGKAMKRLGQAQLSPTCLRTLSIEERLEQGATEHHEDSVS